MWPFGKGKNNERGKTSRKNRARSNSRDVTPHRDFPQSPSPYTYMGDESSSFGHSSVTADTSTMSSAAGRGGGGLSLSTSRSGFGGVGATFSSPLPNRFMGSRNNSTESSFYAGSGRPPISSMTNPR